MSALTRFATAAACLTLCAAQAPAETFVGSNVDSRVIIGFDVPDGATQPFLPEGWVPVAFPGGPLAGAEALVVLIDRHVDRDAEGNPKSPTTGRAAVLAGLAKDADGDAVRLYVLRIYGTSANFDAYSNNMQAEVTRSYELEGPANTGRTSEQSWRIVPGAGGEMTFEMEYRTGTPSWGPGEAFPWSNTVPEFSRIYRFNQLVDVVMSTALGMPAAGEVRFSSTVPELAGLFDGSESIVGVLNVPVYTREVFLP